MDKDYQRVTHVPILIVDFVYPIKVLFADLMTKLSYDILMTHA